jgi:hypothetical protein
VSAVDRGVAIAAARHGPGPLAWLVPSFRARVAAVMLSSSSSSSPSSSVLEATLRGREEIDPSWLAPAAAVPAKGPMVARWLERFAEAELVEMPPARLAFAPADMADLPLVPGPVVQRAIEDLGLAQLALALQAAPEALPRIAGHLGDRAHELLAAAGRRAKRGDVTAAVRELGGLADVAPLFAAGARHSGPGLAVLGEEARRQVAQRLPRELGTVLLAEAARAVADGRRAKKVVAAVAGRLRR